MSQQFVGTLTKIATREWQGKTLYNLCVRADDGTETWIGLGNNKPTVSPMSRVSINASQNQKGYWIAAAKDVQHIKDQPAHAPQPSGGKGGGFVDRQASIVMQSSFKTATDQVNALLAAGVFKPAANTKDRKEAAMDAYFAFIEKVAVELYAKCTEPEKFLDEYVADNADYSPNPGPNADEGRPIEDDLPDF